jgi:sugar/nucleoside kinase (ribokinase family)
MKRPQWDVIGLGENSFDHVYRLPRYPSPGGPDAKLEIRSREMRAGGQVVTTLCTCASLGLKAKYLGAFGSDEGGRFVQNAIARRGVDLRDALVSEAPNRYAVILVDETTGERVVLWQRDPRLVLPPDTLRPEMVADTRLVHVDAVDEAAALQAARLAQAAEVPVTTDIDSVGPNTLRLVSMVTVALFAEHVPAALTGEADPETALLDTPPAMLCTSLGAGGAMLLTPDGLFHEPALEVDVVDTTGAGDVFRGAFITAFLAGFPPEAILRFANAAAAVSCTREGALGGVPTHEEIQRLIDSQHIRQS